MKFFSITIFAVRGHVPNPYDVFAGSNSADMLLPIEAISHLTLKIPGSVRGGYNIHVKQEYLSNIITVPISSYNPGFCSQESIELLK